MKLANTKASLRCAVYTRVSTEHGLEQEFNSLDNQREASEAYIKSQAHEGWRLMRDRYDDGGFSGGSMERPALKKLLDAVRARRIDVIVVYKVDRLTRSLGGRERCRRFAPPDHKPRIDRGARPPSPQTASDRRGRSGGAVPCIPVLLIARDSWRRFARLSINPCHASSMGVPKAFSSFGNRTRTIRGFPLIFFPELLLRPRMHRKSTGASAGGSAGRKR